MISHLSGRVIKKEEKSIILDVSGVGYRVFLASKRFSDSRLKVGVKLNVFCYTNSKKDPWEIYGFFLAEESELFDFLMKISGVGPRAALEASAIASIDNFKNSIENNDPLVLEQLFKLGNKKAQAIIFELSRKIKEQSKKMSLVDEEVLMALTKLGFKKAEAKDVVSSLDKDISAEEKIASALKILGKND
jgi:Holliday junction DNA helicase RuvA